VTKQITNMETDERRQCPGSDLVLPSDLVDESKHRGFCPDCGQWVAVWLSESWFRALHWEPVNADTVIGLSATKLTAHTYFTVR
jgi:hypothetical protein